MQQTYLRSTNAIHPIPLSTFLLLTFGSAWLIWSPLLVAEYLRLTLPVPPLVFITLGSFAPTILIATIPELMQSLLWLSLFGSVLACGDLVGAGLIFFQIPRLAIVRNKGWKTYWKSAP